MRYGMMLSDASGLDRLIEQARRLADDGFQTAWMSQIFGMDALMRAMAFTRASDRNFRERLARTSGGKPPDEDVRRAWMGDHG